MRFAYADPPYLGKGVSMYGDHPDAAVYDTVEGQVALIDRLVSEFPDGWAMSLSSSSLRLLLSAAPDDVRVGAWVKPWASWKPGVNPAYAWEPVIFRGGRKSGRMGETARDWVSASATTGRGLGGVKPDEFAIWILDILGATPEDELVDLFPGSGAVGQAWDRWNRERPLWERSAMDKLPMTEPVA